MEQLERRLAWDSRVSRCPPLAAWSEELWPGCLADSHCHLDLVLRRLREATGDPTLSSLEDSLARDGQAVPDACLGHVVTNLCFPRAWPSPAAAHRPTPRVHLAVGCHPKAAGELTSDALRRLEELVQGRAVVAVGECGLDFSPSCTVPKEVQEEALKAQVNLAIKYNPPLVLHARGAERECFKIVRSMAVPPFHPIHVHCFNGPAEAAREWLEGFPAAKLGVTGLVTFPHAANVHQVVRLAPLSRLLLETDAPFFPSRAPRLARWAPGAPRPEFAQPGQVLQVAVEVARIKGCPLATVLLANLRSMGEVYGVRTATRAMGATRSDH